MTTPDRTRILALLYTRIYGTEETNDHLRPVKPEPKPDNPDED